MLRLMEWAIIEGHSDIRQNDSLHHLMLKYRRSHKLRIRSDLEASDNDEELEQNHQEFC